jgi:hypothetical protein
VHPSKTNLVRSLPWTLHQVTNLAPNEDESGVIATAATDLLPWMKSALDYFLELDGGDNWQDLVECWVKFERLLEYPDRDVSGSVTIRFEN